MRIHIGTFFNVPLFVHWSWFLLIPFVVWLNGGIGLFIMLSAFLFVTLHEYGHCLMAKYFNLTVRDIMLTPVGGGIARLHFPPGRAKEEFLIALAGPFVNFVFAIIFIGACLFVPIPEKFTNLTDLLMEFPAYFVIICWLSINIVMICFNMLPVIPMDGGRVFRAILTVVLGNYQLATLIAVRIAQVLCVCMMFLGFYFVHPMLFVIFFLMLIGSQNELMLANHYTSIHKVKWKVAHVLNRPELETAELPEVIEALEDVEDERIKELLQTEDLIPLLKDAESQKS